MAQSEFYTDLQLFGLQIKDARVENVTALPEGKKGRLVYLTADTGSGFYYHNGADWKMVSDKSVTDALANRLAVVEAATGTGGSTPGESLADKITALQETVGDESKGLVKGVADNKASIETNKTEIASVKTTATNAASKAEANATAITELDGRVDTLEGEMDTAQADITSLKTSVGSSASGLVKDVADLKTIVSDETTGLVKKVADNTTAIGTKANASDVYTKTETDAKVKVATDAAATNAADIKALQDAGYQTIEAADAKYRTIADSFTKDEVTSKINAAVSSAYQVKGTKTYAELAAAEKVNGYVYNVSDSFTFNGKNYPAGTNVVWVGDSATGAWDPLAGVTDLSAYSTSEQVDTKISTAIAAAGHASTTYVDGELAKKVDKTVTVNGHALSANVTVTKEDVGLGNVTNVAPADLPVSTATQTALDGKVSKLVTKPTAGTYTKVVINAEGQVTGGEALAASDIPALTAEKITDFNAKAVAAGRIQATVAMTASDDFQDTGITGLTAYPSAVTVYNSNGQIVFAAIKYDSTTKKLMYQVGVDLTATVVVSL